MDSLMEADFLVFSTGLRVTYRNVVTRRVSQEGLKGIVDSLTSLANTLNAFADRAAADIQGKHALMVTRESFEDAIALLWQIAWVLSQQGLEVNSMCEQLRHLHTELQEVERLRRQQPHRE